VAQLVANGAKGVLAGRSSFHPQRALMQSCGTTFPCELSGMLRVLPELQLPQGPDFLHHVSDGYHNAK